MSKAAIKNAIGMLIPLTIAVGCAHRHNESAASFSPLPAANITPTSTGHEERVYAVGTQAQGASLWTAPTRGEEGDWQLAEKLSTMLTTDRSLAPYPSQVTAAVDKSSKGMVRLTGTIVDEGERQRLRERIQQLPGVTQVDDQLVVASPMLRGKADMRSPK